MPTVFSRHVDPPKAGKEEAKALRAPKAKPQRKENSPIKKPDKFAPIDKSVVEASKAKAPDIDKKEDAEEVSEEDA